ncbi:MAG: response regulator transcription factor [Melioribacteraceae bacterium]|nr:response regulator transcription factor [Melioribacteraceae bacterium]
MKKILIIEDEAAMRSGLKDNLEIEGYEIDEAEDGIKGLEKIKSNKYNLIILDVMMPGLSGFDVCKKTRALGIFTPIILLTAKGEEIDKVLGLELGADDYVTKPFSLRELLARVKVIFRRSENNSEPHEDYLLGKLKINFTTYNATSNGVDVKLSHREYEILKYLIDHRNQTVSRDSLLKDVWGFDSTITTRTIDNFILKLRQKIEHDVNHPQIILTIYGIGYKIIL